jgi:hypothetical protein
MTDKQEERNNGFAYILAADKLVSLIQLIDQTMDFMQEYKIKPDGAVKTALAPMCEKINDWLEDEDRS